jgi:hypothetical protein
MAILGSHRFAIYAIIPECELEPGNQNQVEDGEKQ